MKAREMGGVRKKCFFFRLWWKVVTYQRFRRLCGRVFLWSLGCHRDNFRSQVSSRVAWRKLAVSAHGPAWSPAEAAAHKPITPFNVFLLCTLYCPILSRFLHQGVFHHSTGLPGHTPVISHGFWASLQCLMLIKLASFPTFKILT